MIATPKSLIPSSRRSVDPFPMRLREAIVACWYHR
jgi:hypothetical protein